jgi:hypothetical protein
MGHPARRTVPARTLQPGARYGIEKAGSFEPAFSCSLFLVEGVSENVIAVMPQLITLRTRADARGA